MTARWFTLLSRNSSAPTVKHYQGLPPEVTGGADTRLELGPAAFLATEEKPDGVFLYRYDAKGACVGDTWHKSLNEAKSQAAHEYGVFVHGWHYLQPEVKSVFEFWTLAKEHIRPFDPRIAAAAKEIHDRLRGWRRDTEPGGEYESLDLIGREEFDSIVGFALEAADAAGKGAATPAPAAATEKK
jgi:hypothetical protein